MPGQPQAMGSHSVFHSHPLGIMSGLQPGLLFALVTRPEQTSASISSFKQLCKERGNGEHTRREQNPPSFTFTFPLFFFLFGLSLCLPCALSLPLPSLPLSVPVQSLPQCQSSPGSPLSTPHHRADPSWSPHWSRHCSHPGAGPVLVHPLSPA